MSVAACPAPTRYSRRGGTIKITVWLITRERATYITAAEVLGLALVLFATPGSTLRLLVGLPLLAHLGYTALTSLPLGMVPGRPEGSKQERRNQELRTRVVAFLNEVRRVEEYAQRARLAGHRGRKVEESLRAAEHRMMAAAADIAKATGRSTPLAAGTSANRPKASANRSGAPASRPRPPASRPTATRDVVRDEEGVRVVQVDPGGPGAQRPRHLT